MVTLRISYKDRIYEESLELPKNFSDRFDPLGMHGILIGTASALLHKILFRDLAKTMRFKRNVRGEMTISAFSYKNFLKGSANNVSRKLYAQNRHHEIFGIFRNNKK